MYHEKLILPTKTNSEGRVTIKNEVFIAGPERDSEDRGGKDAPNPRHYEDFNKLLGGVARNSE